MSTTNHDAVSETLLNLAKGRAVAPSIYNYEAFTSNKYSKLIRAMLRRLTGHSPYFDKTQADDMSMLLWEGDDLCNRALISMQRRGENPHAIMEQLLNSGITGIENPTEEMQKLWEHISAVPDWVDWDKLELGSRLMRALGQELFQFFGVMTIDSYRNEFIMKPLMYTGQYSDSTAFNRFLLTCNFWVEVSEIDGMRQFNQGWKVALRVRMLHTLIRQSILASGKWDAEKLGMPINYVGMLGAPLISGVLMPYQVRLLGFKTTQEEVDASMHLWRYVHHLMGGDDKVYPKTIEEGIQTAFTATGMAPLSDDPDGIRLGSSFIKAFIPQQDSAEHEVAERRQEYQINLAHSFFFVAPSTKKLIKMPNTFFPMLKYMTSNFFRNRKMSKQRLNSPQFANDWDEKMTVQRRAWLMRNLKEHELEYKVHH